MNSEKTITVIIPNYNGIRFLPKCIEALKKQNTQCFDILVVDNASFDGSIEWLKENGIAVVQNSENLGFAEGVNVGIRACQTQYVVLLNNDTEVFENFIEELVRAIERSRKIFAVSAMMIKADRPDLVDDAGDSISLFGWAWQRGNEEPLSKYEKGRSVFSACAGAAIYRRDVLLEIGLFDKMHFAYLEDIDISYRARLYGYRSMYCPKAKVLHLGSATSGSKYNDLKVRLTARNNIFLHYKNQPAFQLLINSFWLILGVLVKGVFFARKGFLKSYVQGIKEGMQGLDKCKKCRVKSGGIITLLAIEWDMISGTVLYIKKQAGKLAGRKKTNLG